MAATFVVEDGTGLATANAFVSVAAADQYIENYGNSAVWTALDDAAKEEHIRLGARFLTATYRGRWPGSTVSSAQRLPLPRNYACDIEGHALAANEVWAPVEEANILAALKSAEGTLDWGTESAPSTIKRKKIKIGDIEIDKEWTNGESTSPSFEDIGGVLSKIITAGNTVERA